LVAERSIASFAAGCAVAAFLYALIGFWRLAVPVGIATAVTRGED
jgi:hypothetical protein